MEDWPPPYQIRTWQDAEACAARWMRYFGFADAAVTAAGPDGGVDVTSSGALAQVKFQAVTVGAPELQRLFGARGTQYSRWLLFFTGTGYSARARHYAEETGIALFTYDLLGQVQPVNGRAHELVIAAATRTQQAAAAQAQQAAAARSQQKAPPPWRQGAPSRADRKAQQGWRGAAPSGAHRSPKRKDADDPAAAAQGGGCLAAILMPVATFLLMGITAGLYRPGFTGWINLVLVLGALAYVVGLASLGATVQWGRRDGHRWAAAALVLLAGGVGIGFWIALARHADARGGSHAGLVTVVLMALPLVALLGWLTTTPTSTSTSTASASTTDRV